MVPQLVVSGLALGSIYALLALSLVLINKATDVVNFAQGEMAMFGTFVCFAGCSPRSAFHGGIGAGGSDWALVGGLTERWRFGPYNRRRPSTR